MSIEDFMVQQTDVTDPIPNEIDSVNVADLSKKTFYKKYLSKAKPVYVKDMAKEWPAYTLWKNETYLREKAGDIEIKVEETPRASTDFAYFQNTFGKKKMTFGEFLDKVRDPDRKKNYYFAEETVPAPLLEDVIVPHLG